MIKGRKIKVRNVENTARLSADSNQILEPGIWSNRGGVGIADTLSGKSWKK